MRVWIILLCVVGLGCAAKSYEQGHAPIYGCMGDEAVWKLTWRENANTYRWHVIGEYRWEEWTEGRPVGDVEPAPVVEIRRFGNKIDVNTKGKRSSLLSPVYECTYLTPDLTLMFYARHVRRMR